MNRIRLFILVPLMTAPTSFAAELLEPALNHCNHSAGITKCEVICKRSVGNQCLITHIHFEGNNLKSQERLVKAKFQTCKNANLDLQIGSLTVELEKLDNRETQAKLTAQVSASGKTISLQDHPPLKFNKSKLDARLPRTYFKEFISSGEDFVEAQISLIQCGHEDGFNSCKLHGTLIAVTDPNIRCDFHDNTQAGAYVEDIKQNSKSKNGIRSIGRIGE